MRLGLFVLTPTIYGVENTLLYVPNDAVTAAVDGWSTIWAGAASLVAYVVVAAVSRRHVAVGHPAPALTPAVPDLAGIR